MKGSRNFKVIFGWFFLACGIVLPMAMLSGGNVRDVPRVPHSS